MVKGLTMRKMSDVYAEHQGNRGLLIRSRAVSDNFKKITGGWIH